MAITIPTLTSNEITKAFHQKTLTTDYVSESALANRIPCSNANGFLDTSWLAAVYGMDIFKKFQELGTIGVNTTIDCNLGDFITLTLGSSIEITLNANVTVANAVREVRLVITSSNDYTITWTNTIQWPDNITPVLQNGTNVYTFFTNNNGTSWIGYSNFIGNSAVLPIQTTHDNSFLFTNGSTTSWKSIKSTRTTITATTNQTEFTYNIGTIPSVLSTITVYKNGSLQSPTIDYTIDIINHSITFLTASNNGDIINIIESL